MATFTFTVVAAYINITAGTGSLENLYQDLFTFAGGAETYMVKTEVNPYIYAIQGNRALYINNGVTLNLNNPGDELRWTLSASKDPLLYVYPTGTLTAVKGCIINCDTNAPSTATIYSYIYFSGKTTFEGTEESPVVIKNYYYLRIYSGSTTSYNDWNYVTLGFITYSTSGYSIYFMTDSLSFTKHKGIFRNVNITETSVRGYGIGSDAADLSGVTFDNFLIKEDRYAIESKGSNIKFTNSKFQLIYNQGFRIYGNFGGISYLNTYSTDSINTVFQSKVTFENCVFEDNYTNSTGNRYCFWGTFNSIIKFKNCSFIGKTYNPIYSGAHTGWSSVFLWEGNNTFTNCTNNRTWETSYPGQHLHVYPLEMHVKDREGNYIEGAIVKIKQAEGKEDFTFITYDSAESGSGGYNPSGDPIIEPTGNVRDCLGDNPVFVYREETSASVYTNWSDSIEDGRYHQIIISKPGYRLWTRNIVFDKDQYIEAILEEEGKSLSLPIAY